MNTNMIKKAFIFMLGATAGSLVTWKLVEKKYKDLADEEIESVIERFKNRAEVTKDSLTVFGNNVAVASLSNEGIKCAEVEIEEKSAYEKLVRDAYNADEEIDDDGLVINTPPAKEFIAPYVISPEEYGEFGNDTKNWTMYTDGVITDEAGEIVVDPESMIGDALKHFGEFEEDSVHVRDENIECDYEIIKVEQSFSELNGEEV